VSSFEHPAIARIRRAVTAWHASAHSTSQTRSASPTADGGPTPKLDAALARAKQVAVLELVGFIVIFTSMIMMRFGL